VDREVFVSQKLEPPAPPKGLSAASRRWWRRLAGDYGIRDAAGELLLETALRSLDRAEQARAVLDRDGVTSLDSRGRPKQHPAVTVERDARAGMLAALKALNLDVLPLRDGPGRPGGR
jgi:P27 family predicted phage terminase small subunit